MAGSAAFSSDTLKILSGFLGTFITLGIAWGAMNTRVTDHAERLQKVEQQAQTTREEIPLIKKDIESIKEDVGEVQENVKGISLKQIEQSILLEKILFEVRKVNGRTP